MVTADRILQLTDRLPESMPNVTVANTGSEVHGSTKIVYNSTNSYTQHYVTYKDCGCVIPTGEADSAG